MRAYKFSTKIALGLSSLAIGLASLAAPSSAMAATNTAAEIAIPVSTVVRNVGVGNSKELATQDIEEKYIGMVCSVMATAENQSSVHPGNNLVVASGDSEVVLEDVERASNVATEANGELTLANRVSVSLVMGQDNVFSAGMDVVLSCVEDPEIEVCRDGEYITIPESERLESDLDACKQPHVNVTVCRDDKIVTVPEDEVLPTDILDQCPETLGTQTLPVTGAGALTTGALTLLTSMSGIYGYIKNRE